MRYMLLLVLMSVCTGCGFHQFMLEAHPCYGLTGESWDRCVMIYDDEIDTHLSWSESIQY